MADDLALVTGGTGFIGSHLVEALVAEGHPVRVVDSLIKGDIGWIRPLIDDGKVEFIEGDIRSRDLMDRVMRGVDYVFHTAGVHIKRSVESPEEAIQVNIQGSYNVFRSALEHDVKRVVFSSSSSIYGDPERLPMSEEDRPNPVEPYGASKWMVEQLLQHLAKEGLEYNALRYFNVYGERQAMHTFYTTVIILFIKRLLAEEPPLVDGEGTQSMDFTHVSDVVRANVLASRSAAINQVFNVGTGVPTTLTELIRILSDAVGVQVEPQFSGRPSIVSRRQADTRKARELLGFTAKVGREEGLSQIAQAIAAHPERYV